MSKIFRLAGLQTVPLQSSFFASQDGVRKVVESNLKSLFSLAYLESNFHLVDLPADAPREIREIDTLAFDPVTYAPVAIEYRERISPETASHGVSILRALPTQAQIVKYLVKRGGFNADRIEWSRMRVIFLAREVASPPSIPSRSVRGGIELWECSLYAGDVLLLEHAVTFPMNGASASPAPAAAAAPPA